MVIRQLCVFIILHIFFFSANAEIIVKTDSIEVVGFSAISTDKLNIYGGIASAIEPVTGASNSTFDTCAQAGLVTAKACNQTSIHGGLRLAISFKTTKSVTNAVARMYIESSQVDTETVTTAANGTTITLETTWGAICTAAGLDNLCRGSSVYSVKNLKVGVDEDASGDVEEDERKTFQVHLHYIDPTDTTSTQFYCTSPSGSGMCNIAFTPGDKKVFIDSALYAGNDSATGNLKWDAIAIFPVLSTPNNGPAFSNFITSQASPIFRAFNPDDGTIPDSSVTGGLENDNTYCLIYATRNQAGNIYRIVNDPSAAATACVTPGEVVGILEDKSCFISTAAFGSEMSDEVNSFRKFRNEFLVPNIFGRLIVKTYYQLSPPLANLIKKNEAARASARLVLYPFLFFAKAALTWGLVFSFAFYILLSFSLIFFKSYLRRRK
jgi:hypothetical protein